MASIPRWAGRPLSFGARTFRPYWFRLLLIAALAALPLGLFEERGRQENIPMARQTEERFVQVDATAIPMSRDFLIELGIDIWDPSVLSIFGGTIELNADGSGRVLSGQAPSGGSPERETPGAAADFLDGPRLEVRVLTEEQQASARRLGERASATRVRYTTGNRQRVTTTIVAEQSTIPDYELSSGSVGTEFWPIIKAANGQPLPFQFGAAISDKQDQILIDLPGARVTVPDGGAVLAIYQTEAAYSFVLIEAKIISLREE